MQMQHIDMEIMEIELSKRELTILIRSLTTRIDRLEELGKPTFEYEALEERLRYIRNHM